MVLTLALKFSSEFLLVKSCQDSILISESNWIMSTIWDDAKGKPGEGKIKRKETLLVIVT